jgi:hypothetical protein
MAALVGWLGWSRLMPAGRLQLPAGPLSPKISLGRNHGLVLAPDGSLWSWGGEDLGWPALGRGDTNGRNFSPELGRVGSDKDWVQISAGQDHNLALKADGSLWAWGANYQGQLGNGQFGRAGGTAGLAMEHRPVPSAPGHDWAQVEAGSVCSYAIKTDGTLWAWGLNNFCQLGIGSWIDSPKPVRFGTATNWTIVRAGGVSAGGIQSDGSLWIWGGSPKLSNTKPQSPENLMVPVRVSPDTNWVDLTVTFGLWAAVKSDGTLWEWGREAGHFGGSPYASPEIPTRIGDGADWRSVSGDKDGLLLRKRDGSRWRMRPWANDAAGGDLSLLPLPTNSLGGDTAFGAFVVLTPDREVWAWARCLASARPGTRYSLSLEPAYAVWAGKTRWTIYGHPGSVGTSPGRSGTVRRRNLERASAKHRDAFPRGRPGGVLDTRAYRYESLLLQRRHHGGVRRS